jgi:hypothetical protein
MIINIKMEDKEHSRKIQMILRQTDYSEIEASTKLDQFDNDEIMVIKDFLGIKQIKEKPLQSINQEIYKQIRFKLDSCMRDFESRKEAKETKLK